MIIILSVIIVLLLIYKYAWPKEKYWEGRGLPAHKIKMFLSTRTTFREIGDVYKKMKVEGQRAAGLYLTWENVLFFSDLQLLENIATVNNKSCIKDKRNGKELFDIVLNSATNLVIALQDVSRRDKEIDFGDLTTRYASELITSMVFGAEFFKMSKVGSKIRDMSLRAGTFSLKTLVKRCIIEWFPQFTKRLNMNAHDSTAHKFFIKTIQEAMEYRKQSITLRHDFLQRLLDAENADGEKMQMTIEEIAEHVMSFFVAGVETSAVTIGYSLIEIKHNINVESKLRREVCTVLEKYNYTLNNSALNEMIYLEAVVRETIRMFPPVPILRQKASEDFVVLDSKEIEKNTVLAVSVLAIQRDQENYAEPDLFNPERFDKNAELEFEGQLKAIIRESTECIDRHILMLQCKIALALILWNFDYEISDRTKYPLTIIAPNGVLISEDSIWLKFSPLITSL